MTEKLSPAMIHLMKTTGLDDFITPGPTRAALMRRGLVFKRESSARFGYFTEAGRDMAAKLQHAENQAAVEQAPICLNTTPAHIGHMKAVDPTCRLEPLPVVGEAHAIINDPLEAPMTPGPGNQEYRTPANVKATDRTLGAYDRQLFAFHQRVWANVEPGGLYLDARTALLGRMHAEALQDDLIRDLSNIPTPAGYLAYLAARARVSRDHSEAIQEQWYQAMDWLISITRGRLKWRTEVMNQANRIGRRDLWEAIRDAIDDDYWACEIEDIRRREDAELQDRAKARLVARLV